ncbi:hypothetical protein HMPREF3226_00314 [Prevotella corporis]|uniref:Uncharacterized protein n=1 Tax=Prevotella corporis TaxID=28128 RepID=A0A133QM02_9BACT|nr:hypothetical protein HMPREF3226_00314 [Prevotella corporis]
MKGELWAAGDFGEVARVLLSMRLRLCRKHEIREGNYLIHPKKLSATWPKVDYFV